MHSDISLDHEHEKKRQQFYVQTACPFVAGRISNLIRVVLFVPQVLAKEYSGSGNRNPLAKKARNIKSEEINFKVIK